MLNRIICDPSFVGYADAFGGGLPELGPLKTRQQSTWGSGDFAVIGTTLQIVGEELCEALDLRAGQRVLDVAAGNGNAAIAAARRWCDVTASDYVPALLQNALERARAERLPLRCEFADAEALPYEDGSFDAVTSTFGAMFTPDHQKPAQRDASRLPIARQDRSRELDAGWVHRPFVHDNRQIHRAAHGDEIARALGNEIAHRRSVRRGSF
jgi:SAM-dependent methyltransferase